MVRGFGRLAFTPPVRRHRFRLDGGASKSRLRSNRHSSEGHVARRDAFLELLQRELLHGTPPPENRVESNRANRSFCVRRVFRRACSAVRCASPASSGSASSFSSPPRGQGSLLLILPHCIGEAIGIPHAPQRHKPLTRKQISSDGSGQMQGMKRLRPPRLSSIRTAKNWIYSRRTSQPTAWRQFRLPRQGHWTRRPKVSSMIDASGGTPSERSGPSARACG